eukprot:15440976-Alexandrium_andersonii.AAC.1
MTDLRRQRRDESMRAAFQKGQSYLQHNMDTDCLLKINEYTFPKDSATAWQNVAHLRLEWAK